jgi:GTP cyclohydrolase IB
MNAPRDPVLLPDVQSSADARQIAIQLVGIKSLTQPVSIATPQGAQPSIASADMFVALPAHKKGTHMSRFIEVLQAHRTPLSVASLRALMHTMLMRLEAEAGSIVLRFPYFIEKTAPVTGVRSLMDYQVQLRAEQDTAGLRITQQITAPVTSLCPCSKQVSDYGAHNQRSHLTLAVELNADMTVDEQVRFAEQAASAEMWGLLKRADEKYVTERAYDNPKFVEDMVRDLAIALNREPRVLAYTIEAENFESIHNHSAYARIEHDKRA